MRKKGSQEKRESGEGEKGRAKGEAYKNVRLDPPFYTLLFQPSKVRVRVQGLGLLVSKKKGLKRRVYTHAYETYPDALHECLGPSEDALVDIELQTWMMKCVYPKLVSNAMALCIPSSRATQ